MSNVMPAMSGITDYFDMTSLDVEGGVWRNILAGNDMTISGGAVEDDALKLVSGEWGEVETAEPMTIYILLKKPVRETDFCIIAKGLSAKTQKADLGLWSSGDKSVSYTLSIYGSPYVRTVVDDSVYHVVVLAKKSAIDTDSQGGAMLYVDGVLKGFLTGTLTGSYAGFVTLNRRYNAGYTSACETDTFIRAIAIGGEQTVEQIVTNSEYLINNTLPTTSDSQMAGADAAAIAWCIKQTIEQAKSISAQKLAYRKGLKKGADAGGEVKEPFDTTDPNLSFDPDLNMDLFGGGIWQNFASSDGTKNRYAKIYISDDVEKGNNPINGVSWTYQGKICADIYDADGNYIETQEMITSSGETVWYSTKANYPNGTSRTEKVTEIVTFGEEGALSCGMHEISYDSDGTITDEETINPSLNLYQLYLNVNGYTYVSTSNTSPI